MAKGVLKLKHDMICLLKGIPGAVGLVALWKPAWVICESIIITMTGKPPCTLNQSIIFCPISPQDLVCRF